MRTGRPPEPDALRRDRPSDQTTWTLLPAEGRQGQAPTWPLSPAASPREDELWSREWRRPQAVAWETLGLDEEVALYVRTFARAEAADARIGVLALHQRQRDALGLSAPGIRSLRWVIAPPTPTRTMSSPAPIPIGRPTRERFRGGDALG